MTATQPSTDMDVRIEPGGQGLPAKEEDHEASWQSDHRLRRLVAERRAGDVGRRQFLSAAHREVEYITSHTPFEAASAGTESAE